MAVSERNRRADTVDGRETHDAAIAGRLVVNADDWGRDRETTDRTHECVLRGGVSSVSAMVFMEDSERSADIARRDSVDAGLHLNLTMPFSSLGPYKQLTEHYERAVRYLRRHRLAPTVFHPGLRASFEYLVKAQLEEYERLYGQVPDRIDGHHHMHLCANVLWAGLLPAGVASRRNFSFRPGEKSLPNRVYRMAVDRLLARRHRLADYLFSLPPIEPKARLVGIIELARRFHVEVETHPIDREEYRFLTSGELLTLAGDVPVASRFWPQDA
jgi:chitin disaccharide deacetylase